MTSYELKVFDDGEYAVRKITQTPQLPINVLFSSNEELQNHLASFLYTRWPINEVLDAIEKAQDSEWTEFKLRHPRYFSLPPPQKGVPEDPGGRYPGRGGRRQGKDFSPQET